MQQSHFLTVWPSYLYIFIRLVTLCVCMWVLHIKVPVHMQRHNTNFDIMVLNYFKKHKFFFFSFSEKLHICTHKVSAQQRRYECNILVSTYFRSFDSADKKSLHVCALRYTYRTESSECIFKISSFVLLALSLSFLSPSRCDLNFLPHAAEGRHYKFQNKAGQKIWLASGANGDTNQCYSTRRSSLIPVAMMIKEQQREWDSGRKGRRCVCVCYSSTALVLI